MIKRKRAIERGERKQLEERERERAIGGRERVGREKREQKCPFACVRLIDN
jgi:hypothetical protein